MIWSVFTVLALLQLKHFLCDYVLQTPYQLQNKGTYGHPGGILHSGLHAAGTVIVLAICGFGAALIAAVAVAEFVVHYHVDWGKEQFVRRFPSDRQDVFWRIIGFDQLLHQLTYAAMLLVLFA